MTERKRNSGGLFEWSSTCDQCFRPRSIGNHAKCSKLRQAANQRVTPEVLPANTTMRRIYISGPMTGLPDFNYPAFNAEAARLRELGYHVENPAENPPQETWEAYMAVCIPQMLTCNTIALLPGWMESRGALRERHAAFQHGITITAAAQITTGSAYNGKNDQVPRGESDHRPGQQHQGHGSERGGEGVHRPVSQFG